MFVLDVALNDVLPEYASARLLFDAEKKGAEAVSVGSGDPEENRRLRGGSGPSIRGNRKERSPFAWVQQYEEKPHNSQVSDSKDRHIVG